MASFLTPTALGSKEVTYRFPFPKKQADLTVPLIAVAPSANLAGLKPESGWPVIVYQHGITTDRSAVLPMAAGFASACVSSLASATENPQCYVTIAIDQPLHGVAPARSTVPGLVSVDDPAYVATPQIGDNSPSATLTERHFGFYLAGTSPAQMVYTDGSEAGNSGSLFIRLDDFGISRENLRQMAVDLMNLNASIATMDLDDDGTPDLDATKVYFVGHSLGGVDGIPFVAINNKANVQAEKNTLAGGAANSQLKSIKGATLLNTGGMASKLLENSPSTAFGAPRLLAGLASAGISQGTSSFESYLRVLQAAIDSGDAINFAKNFSGGTTPVLFSEIVGDGGDNPADQTIPNSADLNTVCYNALTDFTDAALLPPLTGITDLAGVAIQSLPAPLTGTEPVLCQAGTKPTDGVATVTVTRFTEGQHGTPVSAGLVAGDSAAVFSEMVVQTVKLFSDGTTEVFNPSIVK